MQRRLLNLTRCRPRHAQRAVEAAGLAAEWRVANHASAPVKIVLAGLENVFA